MGRLAAVSGAGYASPMLIAIIPIIVLIVGLLTWAVSSNPLAKDAGRGAFFIGLFVAVWIAAKQTVHIP